MLFSTKEDVGAPADWVWAQITDFETFEKLALRRGADIQRVDRASVPLVGSGWKGRAKFRGKEREVVAKIVQLDAPHQMRIEGVSQNFQLSVEVELVALSPRRTRMRVAFEAKPQTLSARLIMQSARLAKTSLTKRYKKRVADFAEELDARYQRQVA